MKRLRTRILGLLLAALTLLSLLSGCGAWGALSGDRG